MSWEVLPVDRRVPPFVSINPHGVIAFSKSAITLLGNVSHIIILVDRERRAVAFRPATEGEPESRKLSPRSSGAKMVKGPTTSALQLLRPGLLDSMTGTVRFAAHEEAGMLVIFLDEPTAHAEE